MVKVFHCYSPDDDGRYHHSFSTTKFERMNLVALRFWGFCRSIQEGQGILMNSYLRGLSLLPIKGSQKGWHRLTPILSKYTHTLLKFLSLEDYQKWDPVLYEIWALWPFRSFKKIYKFSPRKNIYGGLPFDVALDSIEGKILKLHVEFL